jgi:uncharacterized protein (TIGR03435 family)
MGQRIELAVAIVVGTTLVSSMATDLRGQNSSPAHIAEFEVASIRKNTSGDARWQYDTQPGGRFRADRVSLVNLIAVAYGRPFPLPGFTIVGGPSWIRNDRFDVVAKAAGNPTYDQLVTMLRPLLADRFKLRVHSETRDRELFALVRANTTRLGPNMRPTVLDCQLKVDAPPPSTATGGVNTPECFDQNYPGRITSRSMTMPFFARLLMPWVGSGRDVRDETELTGSYELTLTWTPDQVPRQPIDVPPEIARAVAAIDPNGPSLFTAIQEQLGLKLELRKEPVNVIVVDGAEPPSID